MDTLKQCTQKGSKNDSHIPGEQQNPSPVGKERSGPKGEVGPMGESRPTKMWDQDRRDRKHESAEKKITETKDLSEEKLIRTRVFSEGERPRSSERIKEYWQKKKEREKNLKMSGEFYNRSP